MLRYTVRELSSRRLRFKALHYFLKIKVQEFYLVRRGSNSIAVDEK